MGDPGLLQKTPDITNLLLQGGGHREQPTAAVCSAAADRLCWPCRSPRDAPGGCQNAKADARPVPDLAVNHRWPERLPSRIVGGLVPRFLQKGPEPLLRWCNCQQVLTVCAHGGRSPRPQPRSTARCSVTTAARNSSTTNYRRIGPQLF
jgi:hypothetical protein